MEENGAFLSSLQQALAQRREYLEKKELPRLKEHFHGFEAGLQAVVNVLLRKSLIKEDPYKHEQKISEVKVPPSGPVMESDKLDQISIRLSNLASQFDFVNSLYQFSVDFLNLNRVKNLAELVRYISWDKVSDTSSDINTRLVAELIGKVRQGTDSLSAGIVQDAQNQMGKASVEILRTLRELSTYHRESYKLTVRAKLLQGLAINPDSARNRRDEIMKSLKARFATAKAGGLGAEATDLPFYPELVAEILDEDYAENAEEIKRAVVEQIKVHEEKPKKKAQESLKSTLLEAVRLLTNASIPLEATIKKLSENNQMMSSRKLTLGQRFSRWIRKLFQGPRQVQLFEIEIVDATTSTRRIEELDFKNYLDRVTKRWRLFASLSNKLSPTLDKLSSSAEDQILKFLDGNLEEVRDLAAKLPALDAFFKEQLKDSEGLHPRGIKLEISELKNAIIKSNQKKHEYLSRKEELEQMKKLGIDVDVT